MHLDKKIKVGHVLRKHVETSELPVGATQGLDDAGFVKSPRPINSFWFKALVTGSLDPMA